MMTFQQLFKAGSLPRDICRVLLNIATQKKFLRTHIKPILDEAMIMNDGSLDQRDIEKINHYYGLAVPAILGEAFCALRGKKMLPSERWASTTQGAMTGLFDDFFDKAYLADEAIEEMITREERPGHKKSNEILFDRFFKKALHYAPNQKLVKDALLNVYTAQVESKKQQDAPLSEDELLSITCFKGGSSLIFYRSVFEPAATSEEIAILYNLGGLMQLANDIFDVYKDRESGIRTLVTETKHIKIIRNFLRSHLAIYYKQVLGTGFSKRNISRFLSMLSIGIFSRCFVCLDHLEESERTTGNEFVVQQYCRKQLICDMDKPVNMLRSAKYCVNDIP